MRGGVQSSVVLFNLVFSFKKKVNAHGNNQANLFLVRMHEFTVGEVD